VALVVQKYGGTSVADPERIRSVAENIARTHRHGDQVVVVVSAMGKETDDLLRLAYEVAPKPPGRELDMLIAGGDRKATTLVAMAVDALGCPAVAFSGSQVGLLTDTQFGNAKVIEVKGDRIREALERGQVAVVAGSQGVSTDREITFLGRGGSDTTAVALAATLGADSCELFTDVSGVFTADPRIVPTARRLERLSFEEMLEMSATGCPKPAARAVEFARNHRVPLHVRSAFTWEPGTWITEEDPTMEQAIITAVTHDVSEAKVTVTGVSDRPGIAAKLFRALADHAVNVDMIVQNESHDGSTDISFTVPKSDLTVAVDVSQAVATALGAREVHADDDVARVSLIGAGMKTNPGVAATMFETLANAGVNIEMISTSSIRISCVVRAGDFEKAVQSLHEAFKLAA
jgi:aspartate kinase